MPAVPFHGETIQIGESIPPFALMRIARLAKDDVDANSVEGLSALYEMFEMLVAPQDWARFQAAAMRVDGDELMAFLESARDAMQAPKGEATPVEPKPMPVAASVPMWQ